MKKILFYMKSAKVQGEYNILCGKHKECTRVHEKLKSCLFFVRQVRKVHSLVLCSIMRAPYSAQ